jgi:hypothetical protein
MRLTRAGPTLVVTLWDIRTCLRALGAALLALVVVWLVTAASDEGQLTAGARAGRTLPLAPLCSAVGAALALGTARVRQEARTFETLGRSPSETSRAAAWGAAFPSLLVAVAIGFVPSVDVSAFYPRAARSETFVYMSDGFVSTSLGVRIDADGEAHALQGPSASPDDDLPNGARRSAAMATALAGIALSLLTGEAAVRRSLRGPRARRRSRILALAFGVGSALLTLVAFQAAAARTAPAVLAVVPPALLLLFMWARRAALG